MAIENVLVDRVLLRVLRTGVAAIAADTSLLNPILTSLDSDELTKVKERFASNPPSVFRGYPRFDQEATYPQYAVALLSDTDNSEFIGEAEMDLFDDIDQKVDVKRERRRSCSIALHVCENHVDLCAYLSIVAKRIIEVASIKLTRDYGIDLPRLQLNDLVPISTQQSEQVFQRLLTVSVDYQDSWSITDALWQAINGDNVEDWVVDAEKVDAFRDDVSFEDEDDDLFGGSITTDEEDA